MPPAAQNRPAANGLRAACAIAAVTAREAIRQPICLLLSFTFLSAILLLPLLLNYTLGDSARMVRDGACSFAFLGALVLAVALATDTVARDFRRGTAAAVLAKAVPRWAFVFGKAAGAAVPVLLFAALASAAVLLALRIVGDGTLADWPIATPALCSVPLALLLSAAWNYRTGRAPAPVALLALLVLFLALLAYAATRPDVDTRTFPANLDFATLPAALLLALPALMAVALAAGLATFLRPAPAFVLAILPFAAGLVSDPLLAAKKNLLARAAYAILPNIQAFWLLDAPGLADGSGIPAPYLLHAALYAAAWSLAVLLLSAIAFQRQEIAP